MGLIFAEFATSLKSLKIDTAKINPYSTSSLRVLEMAKLGLSENLTHLQSIIFAKISQREKFPIYGILICSSQENLELLGFLYTCSKTRVVKTYEFIKRD